MILSFIDKVTTGAWSIALFIWNIAEVICVSAAARTGGLALELAVTAGALDISDITQYLDHDKSSSISQLINGKLTDLQKLLKYFNGKTTSAFNQFSLSGVLPIIYISHPKDLLVVVLFLFIL